MRRSKLFLVFLTLTLALTLMAVSLAFANASTAVGQAQDQVDAADNSRETAGREANGSETVEIPAVSLGGGANTATLLPAAPSGAVAVYEVEPNDTPAAANSLGGSSAVVRGNTFPANDIDFFSFTGQAGDRVYVATMTAFAAGSSTDSTLALIDTDGVTILETDVNDGSFAASSSSIAGTTLPAAGTYYIRVRATSTTATMRPYDLYFQLQSGSPVAETEPNDISAGGQALPPSGWVSGAIDPAGDNDVFLFALNAGDTVYLSLDLDPERDAVTWNGRVGLGAFGNPASILLVNDTSTTSPNSEAFFFTVKEAGTYYAYVDPSTAGTGDPTWTYHLSVSVFPDVPATASCTTYTSADVPKTIPTAATGPVIVTSTLTIPGSPRIADLDVSIVLTHTNMPDLDVVLVAPGGNQVVLFNDRGASTQQEMNLTLDDEAAIPITSYSIMSGMVYQPASSHRLSWFDDQNAGGDWTLTLYDDVVTTGDGVLQSWSMTICEAPPPPACPAGYNPVTVFSTDFEANDGGFTSSGTQNEWQWGTPNFAPITTCNSGANCWVTDLTGTYNASSDQDLLSPSINLSGLFGPVIMQWAQKHQIESANWDNAYVQVQQVGGANPTRLWQWMDATMSASAGSPAVTIPMSAGWSERWVDISDYAGQSIEALFNLSSDSSVNYAGLAIDDVTITACAPPQGTPIISLNKTVGTDPSVCATGSAISVGPGDEVTYCYEVTNTGTLTLTLHDLEDDQLGTILSGLAYTLDPGDSVFITDTTAITQTTTNVATWTAYNPGPSGVISDTDSATVTVVQPSIALDKTVGTDPSVCATTDIISVLAGTTVVYCYEVTNTGLTTLNLHDLVDSELGTILNGLPYALAPGASASVTETAIITATTVNTATWTAYNAGPMYVSTATDAATVTVVTPSNGLPLEDFNAGTAGFPPAGWTILNNGGTCVWESTQTTGKANLTGGDGFAAEANSDWCGSGTTMNTELRTPFFNLTGGTSPVLLYRYDYRDLGVADQGTVDISTDGGATWINLETYLVSDRGPAQNIVDLSAYIGQPMLQLRFTYFAPGWDWWFQIDDVEVLLDSTPEIVVTPTSLTSSQPPNTTSTRNLNIANTGSGELTWDIVEAPTACATPGDVTWLSVTPTSGVTPVGDDDDVTVTFDSTGLTPGNTYNGLLCVESDDPSMPVVAVSVELTVEMQPTIVVDPTAVDVTLDYGAQTTAPLTITNAGTGDLTWNIVEAPPARTPEDVLYDNGPLVTHPGGGAGGADDSRLQNSTLLMTTLGFGNQFAVGNRMADDFTVPAGGWTLDSVTFYAYQTGSTTVSTITGVYVQIWDGPPNDAGSSVVFGDLTTNRMTSTAWSNIYRTSETSIGNTTRPIMANVADLGGLNLPAGTYWFDWTTDGSLASGPWAPPVTIIGQTITGNALQFTGTWGPANDGGTLTQQDMPFVIEGGSASACASPQDIAWLSVTPDNGSTAAGASSNVTVSLDSDGLAPGDYGATLCVYSNDPVQPLVEVPVTLTVEDVYGVELTAAETELSGATGTTVTYTLTLTNTGTDTDTFDLAATGVWVTTLSDSSVTLAAGDSTTVAVTVAVPAGAADGDDDVAVVTATSQTDPTAADSVTLTTTAVVTPVYGVSISPEAAALSGAPGTVVTYTLTITNNGNVVDTFNFSAGASDWSVTLPASVTLNAGAAGNVTVLVAIPANAADMDTDSVVVTVTSANDATATADSTLTTTAVVTAPPMSYIYLPFIIRQP
ncbi:MAG: immune inhibitor A [Anaerolinea sp.]|nr:immune inhibitor A [Anaerolinea sp.]